MILVLAIVVAPVVVVILHLPLPRLWPPSLYFLLVALALQLNARSLFLCSSPLSASSSCLPPPLAPRPPHSQQCRRHRCRHRHKDRRFRLPSTSMTSLNRGPLPPGTRRTFNLAYVRQTLSPPGSRRGPNRIRAPPPTPSTRPWLTRRSPGSNSGSPGPTTYVAVSRLTATVDTTRTGT